MKSATAVAARAATTSDLRAFQPRSLADVREMLHADRWLGLEGDELRLVLEHAMLLYGAEIDPLDFPPLARMYAHAVDRTPVEARSRLGQRMDLWVREHGYSPVVFRPILVAEPEAAIVARAAIDFTAYSHFTADGWLYALTEIESLLRLRGSRNPGAVFGALVAMGEERFAGFLDKVRCFLTAGDVHVAARVHTQFTHHHSLQYWLKWARELVKRQDEDSESMFGSCASALILCLRHNTTGEVFDGVREFPHSGKEGHFRTRRQWDIASYANLIAADLYWLESHERAPKIFSEVLRCWGLLPSAALGDQFVMPEPT